ncbi:MAG: hypothetical protein J7K36_07030 [Archaeoglobaceae archaeon]|nr:hypothetical protein [Archaeoglobaceae archaeon]
MLQTMVIGICLYYSSSNSITNNNVENKNGVE